MAKCKVFTLFEKTFKHPDGRKGDFYILHSADWAQIVPLTEYGRVVMVNQYRFGTKENSWEFPGGIIDEGETPLHAAKRELLEETGYASKRVRSLGKVSPNPALFNNTSHIFVAEGCVKVSGVNFDENEEIETRLFKLTELDAMVKRGKISHSIIINAVYMLQKYLDAKKCP